MEKFTTGTGTGVGTMDKGDFAIKIVPSWSESLITEISTNSGTNGAVIQANS